MILNQSKCHLLVSGHKHESVLKDIGEKRLWEKYCAKLHGIQIGRHQILKSTLESFVKSWRKTFMMSQVAKYKSLKKRKIIMTTFFESQFAYCPLY